MNFPNREEKKSLANLSDAELAELSPEELEKYKRARENLLGIKKADREVRQMENQEQWGKQVQELAEKHGISVDEAEMLLKRRMGVERPSDFVAMMQMMQPKVSPIEQAIARAVEARADQIVAGMLPGQAAGGAGQSGQGSSGQPNPIVGLLQEVKAAGVQSLYLPDGTVFNLTEGKKGEGGIGDMVTKRVTSYVDSLIEQNLPRLLPSDNKTGAGIDLGQLGGDPALLRLWYEDKWKDEDRRATTARDEGRTAVWLEIAAFLASMFSPEGYEKVKKILKQGPAGALGQSQTEGSKSQGEGNQGQRTRTLKETCWNCMRVFPYEEGEDPRCPYCGRGQKAQCPSCEAIFKPTNPSHIVCPQCGKELTLAEEKESQARETEPGQPPESESAPVVVGGGLLE